VATGTAGIHLVGGPIPREAAAACAGPVTAVRTATIPALPPLRRAKLGNAHQLGRLLWISTVYDRAGATKTIIEPISRGRVSRAVLRGWRCSDGAPLRFWFSGGPFPRRANAETGSKRLAVRLAYLRANNFGMSGYFMFWSAGKWVVEARQGRAVRGTVLFDFPG
jgi:hypothetical protein